jgi:hypothetical protein
LICPKDDWDGIGLTAIGPDALIGTTLVTGCVIRIN